MATNVASDLNDFCHEPNGMYAYIFHECRGMQTFYSEAVQWIFVWLL
jgi:hypothetical protein